MLTRYHLYDWTGESVDKRTEIDLPGDPDAPRVEADAYVEFFLVGRKYIEGERWYYIYQLRTRFRSEHPDWEPYGTGVELMTREGDKLWFPLSESED